MAQLEGRLDAEMRVCVLAHVQRGGTPCASDRILATRYGVAAADLVAVGGWGRMRRPPEWGDHLRSHRGRRAHLPHRGARRRADPHRAGRRCGSSGNERPRQRSVRRVARRGRLRRRSRDGRDRRARDRVLPHARACGAFSRRGRDGAPVGGSGDPTRSPGDPCARTTCCRFTAP